jgi:hypothetical protein
VSPEAFESANALIQQISAKRENNLEQLLKADINPFFLIYACADSRISLPKGFSRQLFWKHLDKILSFKHWKGLDFTCEFASGSTGPRRATLSRTHFSLEEDPEGIVGKLAALADSGKIPEPLPLDLPVHVLHLNIHEDYWGAQCKEGMYWCQVRDLDDQDVASFALLDALSRWLPSWRSSVLKVLTSDVCLMWGIRSDRPGVWLVVRALCEQYGVVLSGKFVEPVEERAFPFSSRAAKTPLPLRDSGIANDAARELMGCGFQGSKKSLQVMLCHLAA